MGLFGFGKKKETTTCDCSCCSACASLPKEEKSGIKVLGSGCAKCNQLEEATKEALVKLGMKDSVEHVTDFSEIATFGVMSTPALVVDGKVVSMGKVLKTDEAMAIIEKARG